MAEDQGGLPRLSAGAEHTTVSDALPALPDLPDLATIAEALPRVARSTFAFVEAVVRYRVIAGHPDTITALRAAPGWDEPHMREVRTLAHGYLKPGNLYTGAVFAMLLEQKEHPSDLLGEMPWSEPWFQFPARCSR